MITLNVVETVLQTPPHKGFIYRLRESHAGVYLHRVPEERPWWTHGVILQVYDPFQDCFVSATRISSTLSLNLASREEALEVIEKQ